jgi:hypothetical protein
MIHRCTQYEEQHSHSGCPQRPFATEKPVIDSARDKADAAVFQQHGSMVKLKVGVHRVHIQRSKLIEVAISSKSLRIMEFHGLTSDKSL